MEFKWPPETIGGLFCDDDDYMGIEYIYNRVDKLIQDLKSKG